jgi:ribosomal protein L37AE/L43A
VDVYSKSILEFRERFATEQACRDYVAKLRWPQGFVCPSCQTTKSWKMKSEIYWCSTCHYQSSLTAGTLFDSTRKPLRLWFEAMWYVVSQKSGASALGVQRVLGLGSYHTREIGCINSGGQWYGLDATAFR